jgi:penicillin amidase
MSEDEALQFCSFSRFWATFRYLLNHPETPWWAGQYEQLVTRSFIQVVQNLEKRSLSEQKWGSFHTLKLTHPLGLHPVLGQLFNLTEQSMPGGNNVVNNMKISWCQDHGKIVAGPSMRKLVITKNPEKSYGILPAGNSGRVGNQHYNDQVDLFAAGKWRELWMVSKEKLPQVRHQLLITSQKTKDKK